MLITVYQIALVLIWGVIFIISLILMIHALPIPGALEWAFPHHGGGLTLVHALPMDGGEMIIYYSEDPLQYNMHLCACQQVEY